MRFRGGFCAGSSLVTTTTLSGSPPGLHPIQTVAWKITELFNSLRIGASSYLPENRRYLKLN
jgi:hypothetical protein